MVSHGPLGEDGAFLWVVMIISAQNHPWTGDVQIRDHVKAGLPAPSVIRTMKIATIEVQRAEMIGKITVPTRIAVMQRIGTIIAAPAF